MSKIRYFLVRTAQTLFLIFLVLTFLFFFFRLMPGDITDRMLYQGASQQTIEAFRSQWGLDQPLYVQYYHYLLNFATGDAGTSLQFRKPVMEYVKPRLFNSFILIAPAITTGYVVGSLFGGVAGMNRGSFTEKYAILPLFFVAMFPLFFIGIMLIVVFSGWLNWFPSSGLLDVGVSTKMADAVWWRKYVTASFAMHYVLPFTAIALRYLYLPTLIMRTSVIETMNEGFTYFHRITGLPKANRMRHTLKHSFLPVLTMYPVSMTRAVGGLVLIEYVFNWPGIGSALVKAVLFRDFPVVQFVFFLVATFVIFSNYLVDVVYGIIDPRISVAD